MVKSTALLVAMAAIAGQQVMAQSKYRVYHASLPLAEFKN
jgi:hypothetical protein